MSKQFTVHLSDRQRFDVYGFVVNVVQPKSRAESRALQGVFETFGLDKFQDELEVEGSSIKRADLSDEKTPIETGSVDLNTLLDYLDKPGANAVGALKLLAVSDELQRAKEGKLRSVPDEKAEGASCPQQDQS